MKYLLLALFLTSTAIAEPFTGNVLKEQCTNVEASELDVLSAWCIGYVSGALEVSWTSGKLCPPANVTRLQATLIVKKWLSDHPDMLNYPTDILVLVALKKAFPCK